MRRDPAIDNVGGAVDSGIDSFQHHVNLGPVDGLVEVAQVNTEVSGRFTAH